MSSIPVAGSPAPRLSRWILTILVATVVWVLAYSHLTDFADVIVRLLGLERGTHTAEAVHFFFFDTPKVLLLLTGIVFVMMTIDGRSDDDFTTVQLQTSFERGVPGDVGEAVFEARAMRIGRTRVFGEIDLLLPDGRRAAHATTTRARTRSRAAST